VSYSASGDPPGRAEGAGSEPGALPPEPETRAPEPETRPPKPESRPPGEIPHTRTARVHNGLLAGIVVLILLLVFIIENTESVKIAYFGLGFHLPLGVALLLAAIGGALLVGVVGTARIVQLRRRVRHPR
jgi:uncharacterized integral membrane protein